MESPPAQTPHSSSRSALRASLACIQCRNRHMRCDGQNPACTRCQEDSTQCTYTKSRRGGRKRMSTQPHTEISNSTPLTNVERSTSVGLPTPITNCFGSSTSSPRPVLDDINRNIPISDRLIQLYYCYFHAAHPCVLPLKFLDPYRLNDVEGISLLTRVMQYIGSIYTQQVASEPWKLEVENAMMDLPSRPCVFEIQGLLLYAIAAMWTNETDTSKTVMNVAIDRALILGLNSHSFATQYTEATSPYAESCRRTWWQLYITEMFMAGVEKASHFRLAQRSIMCTVDLPCSEANYEAGTIPEPRTLAEWDQREFADDIDTGFSSYSYFIGLCRSLDFSIIGRPRENEEDVKRISSSADAAVGAFRSFCSRTGRQMLTKDGKIDLFIFEANTTIVVYTADIHRYLSTIIYCQIEAISTCGPQPPPEKMGSAFALEASIHTAKILQITELLTDLLTLPVNLLTLSPFTICKIAAPTIALISACKYVLEGDHIIIARDRIRVAMAAMEKLAEVWPRGVRTLKEVKQIAREVFGISTPTASSGITADRQPLTQQYMHIDPARGYQDFEFAIIGTPEELVGMDFGTDGTLDSPDGCFSVDASLGISIAY